jgi:hypothetical protein
VDSWVAMSQNSGAKKPKGSFTTCQLNVLMNFIHYFSQKLARKQYTKNELNLSLNDLTR